VFRSGVLHPVSPTADGGALQAPLQHVRQPLRLHRRLHGPPVRRRTDARSARPHPLPRLQERRATLPLPHHVHAPLAYHTHLRLMVRTLYTNNKCSIS